MIYRGVDIVKLYVGHGYSSVEIAERIGGGCLGSTVIGKLKEAGVTIRQGGRRLRDLRPDEYTNPAPLITPRYACQHKRVSGYSQCPTCDRCQCTPKKRHGTGRFYGGHELCRCGKAIEP